MAKSEVSQDPAELAAADCGRINGDGLCNAADIPILLHHPAFLRLRKNDTVFRVRPRHGHGGILSGAGKVLDATSGSIAVPRMIGTRLEYRCSLEKTASNLTSTGKPGKYSILSTEMIHLEMDSSPSKFPREPGRDTDDDASISRDDIRPIAVDRRARLRRGHQP